MLYRIFHLLPNEFFFSNLSFTFYLCYWSQLAFFAMRVRTYIFSKLRIAFKVITHARQYLLLLFPYYIVLCSSLVLFLSLFYSISLSIFLFYLAFYFTLFLYTYIFNCLSISFSISKFFCLSLFFLPLFIPLYSFLHFNLCTNLPLFLFTFIS